MYFDVYGSTLSIKMLGYIQVPRSHSPAARETVKEGPSTRNEQPLSIPRRPARIPDGAPSSSSYLAPAVPARAPPPVPQSPLRVNGKIYTCAGKRMSFSKQHFYSS